MVRLVSSREWIARSGPAARRGTTLVFRLSRPGVVEFVLIRIAPDCRVAGRFRVRGHAGVNRVRFRGRIGKRILRQGTYLIVGRTLQAGRTTMRSKLLIFGARKPTPAEVRAAKTANACPPALVERVAAGNNAPTSGNGAGGGSSKGEPEADPGKSSGVGSLGHVLGRRFEHAQDSFESVHPLIWIGLGIAIGLLALAAVPLDSAPNTRMAALLDYRRAQIAFAGATTLVGVTLAYLYS